MFVPDMIGTSVPVQLRKDTLVPQLEIHRSLYLRRGIPISATEKLHHCVQQERYSFISTAENRCTCL